MRFDQFQYLWPPRPDDAVAPQMIPMLEMMGKVGQVKKNGTCSVIAIGPRRADGTREFRAMNRHAEDHKAWSPVTEKTQAIRDLPGDGWYVFVAELLHSKVPGIRDINYVFDMLVEDGEYLVGKTFVEREARLQALFPKAVGETFSHRVIDEYLWIAKLIREDLFDLFHDLTAPEDEGIVLKDPDIPLKLCTRQTMNNPGMVKIRKPHKNFAC